jgi:hypothetical protein
MAEEKYKVLASEFLKHRELLEEVIKTGSKIKVFRMAFFISQDIYFEPSEKDIEMAFDEAGKIIFEERKKNKEKNNNNSEIEGNKTEEQDALYLLDLFEKYVE